MNRHLLLLLVAAAASAMLGGCVSGARSNSGRADTELPRGMPAIGVDAARLAKAIDAAFVDRVTERTQAILVLHEGRVVGERYAEGFDRSSRFLSASIAKLVLGGAIGAAVHDGRLALDAPVRVPAWHGNDPRAAITLRQLMQMRSGLDFKENPAEATADTIIMLAGKGRRDVAAYAASRPLAHPPGSHFSYSSGDTNIASSLLRDATGGTRESYRAFLDRALFGPIGSRNAIVEFDAAGTWIASTNLWASAEDYARYGWLLLNDGIWQGKRLLPEGWVAFITDPTQKPNLDRDLVWQGYGAYAASTQRDARDDTGGADPMAGTFGHMGTGGELLLVDPRRRVVIVRLGRLRKEDVAQWIAIKANAADILAAFPLAN